MNQLMNKMKNKLILKKYEKEWRRELRFWLSKTGKEIGLCLVAQGYSTRLFGKYLVLFGSGFSAMKIIKLMEEEINNETK